MSYAKAVVGALVAGLSSLLTGLDDGTVTPDEIVLAVIAALVAAGTVWGVPNRSAGTPPATHKETTP